MRSFTKVLGLLVVVVLGAGAGVVVGCGSSDSSSTKTVAAATRAAPSYLFSFEGVDASMKPVGDSDGVYSFSMPIDSATSAATWFSDRPNRDAGTISMTALTSLWTKGGKGSFKADPPNVAFVYDYVNGTPKTMIAQMSNTKIVDNPNSSGELLEATMTVATDQAVAALAKTNGNLAVHAKRHTTPTTMGKSDMKRVAVFVDGDRDWDRLRPRAPTEYGNDPAPDFYPLARLYDAP